MLKNFNEFWAEVIISHRIFCIFVIALASTLSVFLIIKSPLKYDNSFEMFMLKDDPNIVKFENFRELFGDAEYLSIGITSRAIDQDIFAPETIKIINIKLITPKAIRLVRHPKNSAKNPPKIKQEIGIIAIIAVILDICFAASLISKQSLKIVLPTDKQAAAPKPWIHLSINKISILEE